MDAPTGGRRPYRLPQDLKIWCGSCKWYWTCFYQIQIFGRVHAISANLPCTGTVIPAGTEIDSNNDSLYKNSENEEIDDIPPQRLEKTVALKANLVLKSYCVLVAPMRINVSFRDNSVTPHVTYAARAWIQLVR